MTGFDIGVAMFAGVIVMMVLRVPVAIAMLTAGALGYAAILGWWPLLNQLKTLTFSRYSSYTLSIIPLFLLMGELATRSGMSRRLYAAARALLGHRQGGLAMATVGGCAAFGALCGSSIATAATMSQVAGPEMRRQGYSGALATGTLAGGGTLGILIPPSVILVIYAIYTEQSIGALFIAAIIPGLLAIGMYLGVIAIYARVAPGSAPASPRLPWPERLRALRDVWPMVLVFVLVMGGIYRGWFSPTEAAGIGVVAMGLVAVVVGGLRLRDFGQALLGTAATSAMIFLILLGAEVFSSALALSRMPTLLSQRIAGLDLAPLVIVALILLAYLILGCVMDALAMVLLTMPIVFPVILALDLGMSQVQVAIWFGILVLKAVEIGMISPPFGLNLFVINSMMPGVSMRETYVGVLGFCLADILRLAIIVLFPGVALWLTGI